MYFSLRFFPVAAYVVLVVAGTMNERLLLCSLSLFSLQHPRGFKSSRTTNPKGNLVFRMCALAIFLTSRGHGCQPFSPPAINMPSCLFETMVNCTTFTRLRYGCPANGKLERYVRGEKSSCNFKHWMVHGTIGWHRPPTRRASRVYRRYDSNMTVR